MSVPPPVARSSLPSDEKVAVSVAAASTSS